jgi:ribosome-associated translation inhibitor RaiA
MKTKKVKINSQVELEVEEGMSVSQENGVVRVKSVSSNLYDMIDALFKKMDATSWRSGEDWRSWPVHHVHLFGR